MTDLRLRYLVVGYGNIGVKRKTALGERCVATVDPVNPAADFRGPHACPADRYDAAILAVPNDVKVELLRYFLALGKHVLVEKPLRLEPAEAAELATLATRHRAIWYTSYNFRFEPNVIALKRRLDSGDIGRVYRARLFYGNGTAGAIAGTWREAGFGALEDMMTHLVDLTGFVFGRAGCDFLVWERRSHELKVIDHCVLATPDRQIVLEASFLAWKNRWLIEVTGERGSLEMDGLMKWERSVLTCRTRRLPAGVPEETVDVVNGPDVTWAGDLRHFEAEVAAGRTSCDNDLWITRTVTQAASVPFE